MRPYALHLALYDLRDAWKHFHTKPRDVDADPDPVEVQLLRIVILAEAQIGPVGAYRSIRATLMLKAAEEGAMPLADSINRELMLYDQAYQLAMRDLR